MKPLRDISIFLFIISIAIWTSENTIYVITNNIHSPISLVASAIGSVLFGAIFLGTMF